VDQKAAGHDSARHTKSRGCGKPPNLSQVPTRRRLSGASSLVMKPDRKTSGNLLENLDLVQGICPVVASNTNRVFMRRAWVFLADTRADDPCQFPHQFAHDFAKAAPPVSISSSPPRPRSACVIRIKTQDLPDRSPAPRQHRHIGAFHPRPATVRPRRPEKYRPLR